MNRIYEEEAEAVKRVKAAGKILTDLEDDRKKYPAWNLRSQLKKASAEHKKVYADYERKHARAEAQRAKEWEREKARQPREPERPSPSPARSVSTAPPARSAPARSSTAPASSDAGAVVPVFLSLIVVAAICVYQGGEPSDPRSERDTPASDPTPSVSSRRAEPPTPTPPRASTPTAEPPTPEDAPPPHGSASMSGPRTLEGTIVEHSCGDNCYLTIALPGGQRQTGLCAAPLCQPWNANDEMPGYYVHRPVRVTIEVGSQYDGNHEFIGEMDAFAAIELIGDHGPAAPEPVAARDDPPATAEASGWALRVSSDRELEDAKRIESHMKSAGFDAEIVEHDNYYCVIIGGYASERDARGDVDRVAAQSPRGDTPVVHSLAAWCNRQVDAGDHTKCVEYSIRISSTRSLAEAQAQRRTATESGYHAFIAQDSELYRVFAGWYVRPSQAEQDREDVGSILNQGTVVTLVDHYCPMPEWNDDVLRCSDGV